MEGDRTSVKCSMSLIVFLSTPSGWRATAEELALFQSQFISIHALRVEGDYTHQGLCWLYHHISIHALRVEGDMSWGNMILVEFISIHALRVEGDSKNGQSFRLFLRKREKNLPL